jgi:hypothetical protein
MCVYVGIYVNTRSHFVNDLCSFLLNEILEPHFLKHSHYTAYSLHFVSPVYIYF